MKIIDPLKYKILELMIKGQTEPLSNARLRCGTKFDIEKIIEIYSNIKSSERHYIYIDLIPFERFGHIPELISNLNDFKDMRPILMIMGNNLLNQISKEFFPIPILIAKFNEMGDFLGIEGGSREDENIKRYIEKDLNIKKEDNLSNLMSFRGNISDKNLTELLFKSECLDIPCESDEPTSRVNISGRYYRIMPNGMLVSCYLNLKQLGRDYNALNSIAYEIILCILEYFRRDIDMQKEIDVLVTANNTSLMLASCVQAILGKPVIAIDKLGPIPSLNVHTKKLRNVLEDKNVILIEEVIATGNEVDRALFFLNNMNSNVKKIVAIYNLVIGKPMLANKGQIVSLCKPKDELQYVYRSK